MSDLLEAVGQYQIRDLLMGPGTGYIIRRPGSTPHPWPDMSSDDVPYDQGHGIHAGSDLLGGRRVPLTIGIRAASKAAARAALQTLQAAWRPSNEDIELAWMDDLGTFRWMGRPRLADPNEDLVSAGVIDVECRFMATNPFYEAATADSDSTSRTTAGSGFTPPFTPPFTLGASTDGTLRATNDGSADASWTARLDGPLTNPVITNLTTGERLAFTANGGLDLSGGEYVEIDSAARSVLLAGTASRRSQLSLDSRWWSLAPGDTDIELTADAGTGTLSVTWRSAWI